MPKYKVEIVTTQPNKYHFTLLVRRYFVFWFVVDSYISDKPMSEYINNWLLDYNIPHSKIRYKKEKQ